MAAARDVNDELHCVLCCEDIEYSACGSCDHSICLKCCLKLRMLMKECDCPVCRAPLKEVIVSKGFKHWADKTVKARSQPMRSYGILNEEAATKLKVDELLQHKCPECEEVCNTFPLVKDHVRKVHLRYYCEICLKHLKNFTHERKCYTREDLVKHRKNGDADDRSHRGHPLCKFCDERFLDNDDLLSHLRKNHFWCHLCEKDGCQDYFPQYKELREHFRDKHFLCEEGECFHEKLTTVFRTKIDFQAHKAQKHADKLSKAEARQNRQLDIDITFTPRSQDFSFQEQRGDRYGGRKERNMVGASGIGERNNDRPGKYQGIKDRDYDRIPRDMDDQRRRDRDIVTRDGNGRSSRNISQENTGKRDSERTSGDKPQDRRDKPQDRRDKRDQERTPRENPQDRRDKLDPERTSRGSPQDSRDKLDPERTSRGNPQDRRDKLDPERASRGNPQRDRTEHEGVSKDRNSPKNEVNGKKSKSGDVVHVKKLPNSGPGQSNSPGARKREVNGSDNTKNVRGVPAPEQPIYFNTQNEKQQTLPQSTSARKNDISSHGDSTKNVQSVSEKPITLNSQNERRGVPPQSNSLGARKREVGDNTKNVRSVPVAEQPTICTTQTSVPDTVANDKPIGTFHDDFPTLSGNPSAKPLSLKIGHNDVPVSKATKFNNDFPTLSASQAETQKSSSLKTGNNQVFTSVAANSGQKSKAAKFQDDFPTLSASQAETGKPSLLKTSNKQARVPTNIALQSNSKAAKFHNDFPTLSASQPAPVLKAPVANPGGQYSKQTIAKKDKVQQQPKRTYHNEFPTLATLSNGQEKPRSKAPPGLTQPPRPPPGLTWNAPPSMVARPPPGTSENTVSKDKLLIEEIHCLLDNRRESFADFKTISGQFRNGSMTAENYYKQCCELLGNKNIHKVFIKLIDILPDEDKQKQLLTVYNDAKIRAKQDSPKTVEDSWGSSQGDHNVPLVPPVSLNEDYPALLSGNKPKASQQHKSGGWVRGR